MQFLAHSRITLRSQALKPVPSAVFPSPATYIRNQSQLLIMCSELHFPARSKPLKESLTLV
jgi:hypothetical protein